VAGACGRFDVDSSTGAVTVGVAGDVDRSLLDRESTGQLDVVIVASDSRNHSSAAVLAVRLTDVNDRRPVFSSDHHSDWTDTDHRPYVGVIEENSFVFSQPVFVKVASSPPILKSMSVFE